MFHLQWSEPVCREEHGSGTGSVVPYRTRTRRHRTRPGTGSDDPRRPRVLGKPGGWTNTAGLRLWGPPLVSARSSTSSTMVIRGPLGRTSMHQRRPLSRTSGGRSEFENAGRAIRARHRSKDETSASSRLVSSPCHPLRRVRCSSRVLFQSCDPTRRDEQRLVRVQTVRNLSPRSTRR
jgi:hypothetical protein